MTKSALNIVFMGTGDFAVPVLNSLNRNFPIIGVFTKPDAARQRGKKFLPSPIKVLAESFGLPVYQPRSFKKQPEFLAELKKISPNLIIVADYGLFLPEEVLNYPGHSCLNVHPSLLPKWRGPSPIEFALLNGDNKTGVSIMFLDKEMDHGPILAQEEYFIKSDDDFIVLRDKLAKIGAKLLVKIIPLYLEGTIIPKAQEDDKATYSQLLKKDFGEIDWQRSAEQIGNQIKAFVEWPGSYTKIEINGQEKIFKILKASVLDKSPSEYIPGEYYLTSNKKLAVKCGQGGLILEKVQLEGKKPMAGQEFVNGYGKFMIAG